LYVLLSTQMKIILSGGMIMGNINYRKHPRIYKKHKTEATEKIIDINVGTAIAIIAFTFINGIGLGYLLKKKISRC
jgi:hypothetical protein